MRLFFTPLNGTEHGSRPSLITRDRELLSVLEVRIEPGASDSEAPKSVTLPTIPRAGIVIMKLVVNECNDVGC